MEMAHCISYALGHPRTIGVSARGGFLRELFGGLTNNIIYWSVSLQDRRVVHIISIVRVCSIDIHWRVVHIISIVGVCPIDIHQRVVYIISIVGVCLIDIHRRVVHKIDYRSLFTIYIRELSTIKNKYLCLEMVFIHGRMHV